MRDTPDFELISNGKRGDQAAVAELFRRHYPMSLRIARDILRSPEESQDAVQSAYLSAFAHLNSFRGDSCFKTWITRIVLNRCLAETRAPWRRARFVDVEDSTGKREIDRLVSPAPSPEKATWCRELATAHSYGLTKLPSRLREVYSLCAISGLTLDEAAKEIGITRSNAKTRLFRARRAMRSSLESVWRSGERSACGQDDRRKSNKDRSRALC